MKKKQYFLCDVLIFFKTVKIKFFIHVSAYSKATGLSLTNLKGRDMLVVGNHWSLFLESLRCTYDRPY